MAEKKGRTELILSYHDFEKTPPLADLTAMLERMHDLGADMAKIIVKADSPEEVLSLKTLLNRARQMGQPLTAFALGPLSRLSRVLAPLWGSRIAYCSMGQGRESAPGQVTGPEMRRVFPRSIDLSFFNDRTELYGVLGFPVGHSLSPVIHNAALRRLDLNGFYIPIDIEDPALAWQAVEAFRFKGLSVTRPHKLAVLEALRNRGQTIEVEADRLGAVNTVHFRDGAYRALNTDVGGLIRALEEVVEPAGRSIIVAGAGGAARAALFGLSRIGARVSMTNRTEEKGRELAREFEAGFVTAGELKSQPADILINATPLGMAPWLDETPFPAEMLKPHITVMDMVYAPPETRLLREAREKGCRTVGGLSMLLHQAALQFETWTGREAPLGVMRQAAENALETES